MENNVLLAALTDVTSRIVKECPEKKAECSVLLRLAADNDDQWTATNMLLLIRQYRDLFSTDDLLDYFRAAINGKEMIA